MSARSQWPRWLLDCLLVGSVLIGVVACNRDQISPANQAAPGPLPVAHSPLSVLAPTSVLPTPIPTSSPTPMPTPIPYFTVEGMEGVIVITPPEGEVIHLPTTLPGQVIVVGYPTSTPMPTFTPVPTPIPNPDFNVGGPLTLSVPLSPKGTLLYRVRQEPPSSRVETYYAMSIDDQGVPLADAAPWLDEQFDDRTQPLTFALPSPSGRLVAFNDVRTSGGVFYVLDRATNTLTPIFAHPERYDDYGVTSYDQLNGFPMEWHPDEQHILLRMTVAPNPGLWLVNVKTGEFNIIKLLPEGFNWATISPDGQRVAYVPSGGYLEIAAVTGTLEKKWTSLIVDNIWGGWSPDGKWISVIGSPLAQVSSEGLRNVLWLVNPESDKPQPVDAPHRPYIAYMPKWSPNGRYLAVEGQTGNEPFRCYEKNLVAEEVESCIYVNMGIYLFDVQTSHTVRIVTEGISPAWSPNGTRIAFLSIRTGTTEVWVKNLQSGEEKQITDDGRWKWPRLLWLRDDYGVGKEYQ